MQLKFKYIIQYYLRNNLNHGKIIIVYLIRIRSIAPFINVII